MVDQEESSVLSLVVSTSREHYVSTADEMRPAQKPCGGGETWGCKQMMAYVKVETLDLPTGDLPPPPTSIPRA